MSGGLVLLILGAWAYFTLAGWARKINRKMR